MDGGLAEQASLINRDRSCRLRCIHVSDGSLIQLPSRTAMGLKMPPPLRTFTLRRGGEVILRRTLKQPAKQGSHRSLAPFRRSLARVSSCAGLAKLLDDAATLELPAPPCARQLLAREQEPHVVQVLGNGQPQWMKVARQGGFLKENDLLSRLGEWKDDLAALQQKLREDTYRHDQELLEDLAKLQTKLLRDQTLQEAARDELQHENACLRRDQVAELDELRQQFDATKHRWEQDALSNSLEHQWDQWKLTERESGRDKLHREAEAREVAATTAMENLQQESAALRLEFEAAKQQWKNDEQEWYDLEWELTCAKNRDVDSSRAALLEAQKGLEGAHKQTAQAVLDLEGATNSLKRESVNRALAERKARRFQAELLLAIGGEGESV